MVGVVEGRKLTPVTADLFGVLQDRSRALVQPVAAVSLDVPRNVAHRVAVGWWKSLFEVANTSFPSVPAFPYAGPLLDLGATVNSIAEALEPILPGCRCPRLLLKSDDSIASCCFRNIAGRMVFSTPRLPSWADSWTTLKLRATTGRKARR